MYILFLQSIFFCVGWILNDDRVIFFNIVAFFAFRLLLYTKVYLQEKVTMRVVYHYDKCPVEEQ